AVSKQIASGQNGIQTVDKGWRGPLSGDGLDTGYPVQVSSVLPRRLQDGHDDWFAFPFEDRIDTALAMLQYFGSREGSTMSTDHDKSFWQEGACRFRQVNDFWHICQVIAGENHGIG